MNNKLARLKLYYYSKNINGKKMKRKLYSSDFVFVEL